MAVDNDLWAFPGDRPVNTNSDVPWPDLFMAARRRYPKVVAGYAAVASAPILAVAGILWFTMPELRIGLGLNAGLLVFIVSTYLVHSNLTRVVYVAKPDGDRAVIDEERWWREEERRIPDTLKVWNPGMKRSVAWLYESKDGDKVTLKAFNPWSQPLKHDDKLATPAYIAGFKATMKAAQNVARHQEPDGKEALRVGMLALIIGGGLLAVYLAGTRVIDTFAAVTTGTG